MADQFHVVLATDWDARIPGYRKRKVFPKTKSGCSTCKSKKVKVVHPATDLFRSL
jgi:hypothetical protein